MRTRWTVGEVVALLLVGAVLAWALGALAWPALPTKARDWLTNGDAPAWLQAVGGIAGIAAAVAIPYFQRRADRENHRSSHLQLIAIDVFMAAMLARTYLSHGVDMPAYRLNLHGLPTALPGLLSDGALDGVEATELARFYVDAQSFNRSLDIAHDLWITQDDWSDAVARAEIKAGHLIPGDGSTRHDRAIAALRRHISESVLQQLQAAAELDSQ